MANFFETLMIVCFGVSWARFHCEILPCADDAREKPDFFMPVGTRVYMRYYGKADFAYI